MGELLLDVQGLRCGYGEAVVLADVSFQLPMGRSLALLGPPPMHGCKSARPWVS